MSQVGIARFKETDKFLLVYGHKRHAGSKGPLHIGHLRFRVHARTGVRETTAGTPRLSHEAPVVTQVMLGDRRVTAQLRYHIQRERMRRNPSTCSVRNQMPFAIESPASTQIEKEET